MTHHSLSGLHLLLIVHLTAPLLLSLPLLGHAQSPGDFNNVCFGVTSFPESQQTLAYLDAYDSSTQTNTETLGAWMWNDDGSCDNILTVCDNFADASTNRFEFNQFNFSTSGGRNDPVHITTDYSCAMCSQCELTMELRDDLDNLLESVVYSCGSSTVQSMDFTSNESFTEVHYRVTFENTTISSGAQCFSINSYRVWQYMDCEATVFELANYPATNPGLIAQATSCVVNANAVDLDEVKAGCNDTSNWGDVSSTCQCEAGFEPNDDRTACNVCGEGTFKASVGNEACFMCSSNQVSNSGRTGCQCAVGYVTEGTCNQCAANYFKSGGGVCTECPFGSERQTSESNTSCTCTGNRVTSDNSETTTSMDCVGCAMGYTRGSEAAPSSVCNMCVENYFSTDGGSTCVECPAGSRRMDTDDMDSCTCEGDSVTSTGSSTTSDASSPCTMCVENYFSTDGGSTCVECPAGSRRMDTDDMDSCTCEGDSVTSTGSSTTSDASSPCTNCPVDQFLMADQCVDCAEYSSRTLSQSVTECVCAAHSLTAINGLDKTSNPNNGCTKCIPGFSRPPGSDNCTGVIVSFDRSVYTAKESEIVKLFITTSQAPTEGDTINIQISTPNGLILTPNEVALTSSRPNSTIEVTGYDDEIGLQGEETYSVSLATLSPVGLDISSADLVITDDDVVRAQFEQSDYNVSESSATFQFCVTLTLPAAKAVSVTINGVSTQQAESNSLAVLANLSIDVTIDPPTVKKCNSYAVTNDEISENNEIYRLTMTRLSPTDDEFVVDSDERARVTVVDDDGDSTDEPTTEPTAEPFPLTAVIGGVAGGVVLAIILLSLCIICLCFWNVNVKRQGFYPTHEDSQTAPTMLRYSASLRSISSQSVVIAEGRRAAAQQKENEFFV